MADPLPASGPSSSRIATVVGALLVVQLALALLPFGLGALAPLLRDRFALSRAEIGLATTAIFVSVVLLSIPMGHLADRAGVTASLVVAGTLVAVSWAGIAAIDRYAMLLGVLAVGGAGYAAVTPATNKGIIDTVPYARRGHAMGVKQMGVTAGGMVAAAILPMSIVRQGWTTTLVATAVGVAVLATAGAFVYRSATGAARPARRSAPDAADGVTLRLLTLGAVIAIMIAAQHAVATYLTLFVVDERDASVRTAAAALTVLHATGTVARLGWGWVSDRLPGGRLPTIALVGAISVFGLVGLAVAGDALPWPALLALVALLGISTQGGNAVYQTAVAEEDEMRAGRASGIGMTLGFAGAIVMPPAFGAAVDTLGSYTVPFLAVAGGVAAASIGALRLARRSPPTPWRADPLQGDTDRFVPRRDALLEEADGSAP